MLRSLSVRVLIALVAGLALGAVAAAYGGTTTKQVIAGLKDGTFQPTRYRIFQFFPNLLIALFRGQQHVEGKVDTHWYVNVQHMHGVAPGRTISTHWPPAARCPAE